MSAPAAQWVSDVTDAALRRVLGDAAVARGSRYARDGSVLTLKPFDDGRRLMAEVRGSGRNRYTTIVTRSSRGSISGSCTCPIGFDCKHVAAVVIAARAAVPAPAPPAVWESRLAPLVGTATEDGPALALQLEVVGPGGPGSHVRLRPLRLAASGTWVRGGAGWRELDTGFGYSRWPQREALRAVYSAYRVGLPPWSSPCSDSAIYLHDLGPAAWRLLRDVEQAGVVLLDRDLQPRIRLSAAPAELAVRLTAEGPDGGIAVSAAITLDEPGASGEQVLVGAPPHGLFVDGPDGLLLAGFERRLDPVTAGLLGRPVHVPPADLPRFYRRYLPALRRRAVVRGDGVEVPEVAPPRLSLTVGVHPGHRLELGWSFAYRLLDDVVDVPLSPLSPLASDDVDRDERAEQALLDGLRDLAEVPGVWMLDIAGRRRPVPQTELTGLDTARFATDLLPALSARPELDVVLELADGVDVLPSYGESAEPPHVEVEAKDAEAGTDWFDLTVSVTVAGEVVPLARLLAALTHGEAQLLLDSGTWISLDRPELQALRGLLEESRVLPERNGSAVRVSPYQAGLFEELVALGVVAETSERWQQTVGGLLGLTELPAPEPPRKLQAELRPYQLEGYRWLSLLWDLQLGGVLADDMGLGKTVQTLAMAVRAYERGELRAPLLVVAPTSVVGAWAGEAERFCPDLPVVVITETERKSKLSLASRVEGAALAVTSYALLRLDEESYLAQPWSGLVLDEAQHVKNPAAKTYSGARRLRAPFALAITGTPLENSLMDLWALLSITAPGLFPDPKRFTETYRRPIEVGRDADVLAALRRRVRPLMLRRTKEEVATDLPPKIEQVVDVTLTPAHRRIYDRYLQRERQRVLGLLDDLQRNRFEILRALTVLRQLSLDPALVDEANGHIASAKVDALVEHLRELADEGHRALVFSSFTGFLHRVRERLDAEGIGYCYLDGRTRDRPRRIAEFRDGDAPAFLISLKAGGTGLTLTEADYVFVLDPWWNPAVESQAVDRAHRIGQTRSVHVYRLVAAGTVEEKVVALQQKKRDLFAAVVDGDGAASAALTAEDIRALLS